MSRFTVVTPKELEQRALRRRLNDLLWEATRPARLEFETACFKAANLWTRGVISREVMQEQKDYACAVFDLSKKEERAKMKDMFDVLETGE